MSAVQMTMVCLELCGFLSINESEIFWALSRKPVASEFFFKSKNGHDRRRTQNVDWILECLTKETTFFCKTTRKTKTRTAKTTPTTIERFACWNFPNFRFVFFCDSFSKVQNKQNLVNKERQRKFRRKAFCRFLGRQNSAEKSPQRKISDFSKGKKNDPWLDFD